VHGVSDRCPLFGLLIRCEAPLTGASAFNESVIMRRCGLWWVGLVLSLVSGQAYAVSNYIDEGAFSNATAAYNACVAEKTSGSCTQSSGAGQCGAGYSTYKYQWYKYYPATGNTDYHRYFYCTPTYDCEAVTDASYTAEGCRCDQNNEIAYAGTVCPVPQNNCVQGETYQWSDTELPPSMSFCAGGCEYILAPQSGDPEVQGGTYNTGDGVYTGKSLGTGATCTPDDAPPVMEEPCVVDDSGHAICFTEDPECTEFDGGTYCIRDVPEGTGCVYNESGFMCAGNSTPPPNTNGDELPQNGTMSGDQNGDGILEQGDVYNYTTTTTNYGGGGGGGAGCGENGIPCTWSASGEAASFPSMAEQLLNDQTTFQGFMITEQDRLLDALGIDLGSAACSCDGGITVLGITLNICICDFLYLLEYLGYALLFMTGMLCLQIILGA